MDHFVRSCNYLLFNFLKIMLFFQVILVGILTWRFATEYGYELNKALAHGAFHAISSFNNAGFALYSDSMIQFARDGWILVPIFTTVFLASLGFPTIVEMRDRLFLRLAKVFKVIGVIQNDDVACSRFLPNAFSSKG